MNNLKTIDRKEFLSKVGIGFGAILLTNCLQSCGESSIPDPTPGTNTGLDVSIDISQSPYTALQNKGGFAVITSKSIIVARALDDTWIAVSSACTHEGTTVNYRKDSNDFLCPNHGSVFKSTGGVSTGPATTSLKKYNATFTVNTNTLRIFE